MRAPTRAGRSPFQHMHGKIRLRDRLAHAITLAVPMDERAI